MRRMEATNGPDLIASVKGILNLYLDKPQHSELELDQVHRVGPHTAMSRTGTRNVLCRVHFFTVKKEIMRQAWRKGRLLFDGAEITLLQGLSRRTHATFP